jgi:hypothetical protein
MAKKAGKARKTAGRAASRKRSSARKAKNTKKKTIRVRSRRAGVGAKRAASRKPTRRAKPARKRRSTKPPAAAHTARPAPGLERERKRLSEVDGTIPTPPSSLNLDRRGSAASTGRAALEHARQAHTETSPALTGGDVDADWEDAYAVGDEAPGGDNPTPDQDRVDDIGRALGIEYADNEELKAADKISARDKHRWELDPASAEDYPDHEN